MEDIALPPVSKPICLDSVFLMTTELPFRRRFSFNHGVEVVLDKFETSSAICCFLRMDAIIGGRLELSLSGCYEIESCAAGGWLLRSHKNDRPYYWFPKLPRLRTSDEYGRILSDVEATLVSLCVGESEIRGVVDASGPGAIDVAIWQLPANESSLISSLEKFRTIEIQTYFLYGSHTAYSKPADVYAHLIHGYVYEDLFSWPNKWKIPDELDAYALYLILAGLEMATGKELYHLQKLQLLRSVMERQREDGGWYHGEWTGAMESHVRLHCGAMHLLATALEEEDDATIADALRRGAEFLLTLSDQTTVGRWFLHDSLETSRAAMNQGPFPWLDSSVLGKSDTNMMVLNTHLDALIALDRYRGLTNDSSFDEDIGSGLKATSAILSRRPLETIYRLLSRLIELTFLPVSQARRLPLHVRAMKRLAWKYIVPRIHYVRTRWPRLVMPNGFIDRALSLRGVSHTYQAVNVWDLIRYRKRFPEQELSDVIECALAFTQNGSLRALWAENPKKGHALGFWVEALWHLCLFDPDPRFRDWLGEAMILCHDAGFGLPPALLGANAEAVPVVSRAACPSMADSLLRVANLSIKGRQEVVIANTASVPLRVEWESNPPAHMRWKGGDRSDSKGKPVVPAKGWIWGLSIDADQAEGLVVVDDSCSPCGVGLPGGGKCR